MRIYSWACSLLFASLLQPVVADTIHGVLVDAKGAPIARARVFSSFLNRSGKGKPGFLDMTATSRADGSFDLGSDPLTPTADDPVRMMVELSNGSLGVGILPVNGGQVVIGAQTSLTIHIHDSKNNPVSGAAVFVQSVDLPLPSSHPSYFALYPIPKSKWTKRSDVSGSVTFQGLPVGSDVEYRTEFKGAGPSSRRTRLAATGVSTDDVELKRAAIIEGRVVREGKPVAGIAVTASTQELPSRETLNATIASRCTTKTDANGAFRIADAPSGSLTVSVELGELAKEWTVKPYDALQVKEGEELDGLNFVLDKGIEIQGKVLSQEAGKPIDHAQVLISSNRTVNKFVMTAKDGSFEARVPAGQVYVAVQQVAGRRIQREDPQFVTLDEAHNPPLELRVPDLLMYPPIPHLQGLVQNASGAAVSGATVVNLRSKDKVTADSSGHFQLSQPSDPGDLVVAYDQDSMSTKAVEVRDNPDVTLVLDGKPATIEGTVVGDDGKPIQDAAVSITGITPNGFSGFPEARTGADGKYRFSGLYSGMNSFFVWVRKAGFGPATQQQIVVSAGEDKQLPPLTLAPADGTIDGTVLDPDGKPAANASVTSQGVGTQPVQTDDQGHFHLTNVPRGDHFIAAGRNYTFYATAKAHTGDTNVIIKLPPFRQEPLGVVQGNRAGHTAPALKIDQWVSGKGIDPADLKGKFLVLDFWAVWCHPCVQDLPKVEALFQRFKDKGVVVIGIHAPGTPLDKIQDFLKKQKLSYPIGMDPADDSGIGLNHVAFGPSGIPHVILVGPRGRILSDSNDVDDAAKVLEQILGSN